MKELTHPNWSVLCSYMPLWKQMQTWRYTCSSILFNSGTEFKLLFHSIVINHLLGTPLIRGNVQRIDPGRTLAHEAYAIDARWLMTYRLFPRNCHGQGVQHVTAYMYLSIHVQYFCMGHVAIASTSCFLALHSRKLMKLPFRLVQQVWKTPSSEVGCCISLQDNPFAAAISARQRVK